MNDEAELDSESDPVEPDDQSAPIENGQVGDVSAGAETPPTSSHWKSQFYVLCAMLLLALVGMGLSQALETGVWIYWTAVVVIYAGLGLWRSTRKAKAAGKPIKELVRRELSHWSVLLAFLGILLLLERRDYINRQSAADFTLLLLAFSCVLAGVHFDWLLLIMGVVLTVMLVAMATLEKYSAVLWLLMIAVTIAAATFFYLRSKKADQSASQGQ